MPRLSFRATLLASFLLIAGILGAAAVSGWLALEDFAKRSRDSSATALALTTAVQQLGERTVDMERSARQFVVLEDPALRQRFAVAHTEAVAALDRLDSVATPGFLAQPDARFSEELAAWRQAADAAHAALDGKPDAARLQPALARLAELNGRLAGAVRSRIEEDNRRQLDALDHRRERLAQQVLAAIAAAFVLAGLTGWWVVRPLRRIGRGIAALGEGRFDRRMNVGGPADLREIGHRLDWLRLRLADLEANRARVLRHVSHELKTPLASLREGVALLQDEVAGPTSPRQQEVIRILDHNARTLQERIEHLLDYNATLFDARRLSRRRVALAPLVAAVVEEQRLQAEARRVTIKVETLPGQDNAAVLADEGKLKLVLGNLLANALAYAPPGSTVRFRLGAGPQGVAIDCMDEGPGVAAEEAERIFDPFFQGSRRPAEPPRGKAGGSGLGLAIVREFIVAHGGRVAVLPAPQGAHFRIDLPHAR